jgi:hypothetical protein
MSSLVVNFPHLWISRVTWKEASGGEVENTNEKDPMVSWSIVAHYTAGVKASKNVVFRNHPLTTGSALYHVKRQAEENTNENE